MALLWDAALIPRENRTDVTGETTLHVLMLCTGLSAGKCGDFARFFLFFFFLSLEMEKYW